MFEKILIPLDSSELAERALKPGLALAEQGNADVFLVSVPFMEKAFIEDRAGYGFMLPDQSLAQSRKNLQAYLNKVKQNHAHPNVHIHPVVADGDEASVIVDTAVREQVDLIVMSTHGRSGFSRWMLGSVTERVLRQAPCPVLVIREDKPLQHMLITLDGSELSETALQPGVEVAARLGSQLTLFSVESSEELNPTFVAELEKVETGLGARTIEDYYHRTENYLQRLVARLPQEVAQVTDTAPRVGPVTDTILDFIEADKVDLVVMATHGRSGLQRWVYGSITEKIMRSAKCAMLIVRPPSEKFTQ
ncbi:MAG: universal stress protein [Ardenticatenaceae bacterium]|nr:universal stress protein [Ardenticatenaceae bacterium]